jgi:hypothetical protein
LCLASSCSLEEQTTQCPSCSSLENPHCVWHHPVSFDNLHGWWRMRRVGLHWCVCPWKETPRSYSKKGGAWFSSRGGSEKSAAVFVSLIMTF